MVEFGLDQTAVRVCAALAFAAAAAVVLVRVMPRPARAGRPAPAGAGCGSTDGDHESDAAHLLMCAVMSVMVLFPAQVHAHALHGVLLAMTLVFGLLSAARIVRDRAAGAGRAGALGYHLAAAGVMLATMSGHSAAGHGGGPGVVPVTVLALLFLGDAVAVAVTALRGGRVWWAAHPASPGRGFPLGVLPHVIMDLGMAYMLAASATG
ncbi:DUF5134 domain-containing protein [Nocardia flavorosea]|uniref:DUF5134 domain-containing protein n=1 Tax=Nocardia flavorosea TaxID=53429 RepID=A0A846YQC3_9NOCA|nr:DUF5134 domain-containing protein [Nocardia flavorosea]NKY59724.1 DUF5134 domain-containing protein [Nocardia flavorosea]